MLGGLRAGLRGAIGAPLENACNPRRFIVVLRGSRGRCLQNMSLGTIVSAHGFQIFQQSTVEEDA